jgi:3-phosphoshikimate 1-carboxyvinyltransferase
LKTVELLNKFGLFCKSTADGLVIAGGQRPKRPTEPVETHGDHRLAMTAVLLATSCGGEINNPEVSAVTHPEFLGQIGVLSSL